VVKEPKEATPPPSTPPQPQPPQPQPPQPEPPQPPQPEPTKDLPDTPAPKLDKVDTDAPQLETPQEVTLKQPMAPAPKLAEIDAESPKLAVPKADLKPRLADAPALAEIEPKLAALTPPAKVDLKRPPPKVPQKSVNAILNNLTKAAPQDSDPDTPPQPPTKNVAKASGAQAPLSANLTASEMDALQQQLARCWNLPASAKDAQNLVVDLDVTVNPDRTVAHAEVVDQGRMASDPTYAAAARAALRAVRMPACTPLALPPEKYQEWQSMNIHFDPKEMLGQ
jgi:hypothetical protein